MEKAVRSIQKDGLTWSEQAKRVQVVPGLYKLRLNMTVEDEKISIDDIREEIEEFEDYVQSTDVEAMMKL